MEELKCIGCGSVIQTEDQTKPGFIPASKLQQDTKDIICRRCFRLANYNEVTPLQITPEHYFEIIREIGNHNALIVMIIDIFDIEGSLIPQLAKLTNFNDLIVIANKIDLLPRSVQERKLHHHLQKILADNVLKPQKILFTSALKKTNLDDIFDQIHHLSNHRDIYIVGATNVGKSTFINTLLKSYAGSTKNIITVSEHAGTTLDFIKIPFENRFIIDTPGLINDQQLTHYVTEKTLKAITPKKEIKPVTFQLNNQQTLFIGGLARVDFISGEKTSFTCYFSEFLKVHRTKLENADNLYDTQLYKVLTPPYLDEEFPLKAYSFTLDDKMKYDIVFPGLGFISVKGKLKLKVYAHQKTTPYIRGALI